MERYYNGSEFAFIDPSLEEEIQNTESYSILDLLEYIPKERSQGRCGNCWAWPSTSVLAIALNVQKGIKDRLSVQFMNTCGEDYTSGMYKIECCGGGTLEMLADFYSNQAMELTKIPKSEVINVFEVTAPQFAVLFKIFTKFKALKQDEAIFKVANSVILFQKIQIEDNSMFFLFLVDNENRKEKIKAELPGFLSYTEDLLLRYIA